MCIGAKLPLLHSSPVLVTHPNMASCFKGGRVIEALANVKAVALDKTGTITSG